MIIALGSNLQGRFDSRQLLLEAALERLSSAGLTIRARSSWWRSAAWPDARQPYYLNGVALVETSLPPRSTMAFLIGLEASFGRIRAAPNAPRTLDLDLIAHGRQLIDAPGLALPHPRAPQRGFVMGPLAEIAPLWRHPLTGGTARELAVRALIGADACPQPISGT